MCCVRPCGSTVPGGKESAEHACMEEDYKLLPLPLPLPFYSHILIKECLTRVILRTVINVLLKEPFQ